MSLIAKKSSERELRNKGCPFEKAEIKEVVQAVEAGMSRKRACKQYGMSKGILAVWFNQYGSAAYHQEKRRSYTCLQKRTIVCAIQQGNMTAREACIAYHIRDTSTVRKWVRDAKLENVELCANTPPIMAKHPISSTLSTDVTALQSALTEAQLKIAALNTLIDVAEEQLKINIRKKPGAKQSPK